MDYRTPLFFCLTCLFLSLLKLWFSRQQKSRKLPPGPKPWPVVGNIFQLSKNPHLSLTSLSKIYGPLMSLKLGSVVTIVVSSADIAKEIFQKHDLDFSGRRTVKATQGLDHHKYSMVFLPVSPKWRKLRKISAIHLFTKKQLDATELLRQHKLEELIEHVGECCKGDRSVEIGRAAFITTLNLLSNTFFSIDLASHSSESSHGLQQDLVWAILEAVGKPNLADFFPVLGYFDLLGVRRRTGTYFQKFFALFDGIIEHRLSADSSDDKDDVLATLLKISKEDGSDLSLDDIRHLLLDLFIAGTETTSSTFEWAMTEPVADPLGRKPSPCWIRLWTELLRNPIKMEKAQTELDEILGKDGVVRESDIARLPYLQAIVKETLRLHIPGPFLIPHKAENDVNLCGYVIPRNSQLLVNVAAITRDPSTWRDPTTFFPERFLELEIDFRGHHFELLPFGTGRRMCPALPLADRMLHLMLANFLYYFNWKLENGMRGEDVDVSEKFGLAVVKAKPLLAIPVAKLPFATGKDCCCL